MAFIETNLRKLTEGLFRYHSDDDVSVVGYFAAVAHILKAGDTILINSATHAYKSAYSVQAVSQRTPAALGSVTVSGASSSSGPSTSRPILGAGQTATYFDTDLGKLIAWNGFTWVDNATGTIAGPGGYTFKATEAAAVVAAMSVKPTAAQKARIDTLISAIKTAGVWTQCILFNVSAAHTEQAAGLDWTTPGTPAFVPVGSPTFTPYRGWKGDGSAAYCQGPLWSTLVSRGYTGGNATAMTYGLNGIQGSIGGLATDAASQPFGIGYYNGSSGAAIRSGNTTTSAPTISDAAGMRGFTRPDVNGFTAYVDKTGTAITSAGSSAPTGTNRLTLLRGGTTFEKYEVAFSAIFKRSLTSGEYGAVYDAVLAYLQGIDAVSAVDGIWNWDNDPRAIAVGGKVVWSGMTASGNVVATTVPDSGAPSAVVLRNRLEMDDHDSAGLLRRQSDGRLMAWYLRHNDTANFYQRVSTNPDDATSWQAETSIFSQINTGGIGTYSYTAPVQLSGESGKIFNFFRCGEPDNWGWGYATSADDGVTWSAAILLTPRTLQRPYTKVVGNGASRIDIFCNDGHPRDAATNSLYHYYYQGGAFFKTDGTALGAPPYTVATALTKVWDGSTAAGRSWIYDVVVDKRNSLPVAAFSAYPSSSDHRYRQARYIGGVWRTVEICAAGPGLYTGEDWYSGGISTDPEDVNVVYCSRKIDGVYQIFRYVSADDGLTWTGTQLTAGTDWCFRPFVVPGARKLVYCVGRYTSYTDYNTRVATLAIV